MWYRKCKYFTCFLTLLLVCLSNMAESTSWQQEAVKRARILSQVKWTPIAEKMPVSRKGYFQKGTEYTGVPYSSINHKGGHYIGFDVFLKTFLAAVQNPRSILYTETLSDKIKKGGAYYGDVCSSFTSYALGCAISCSALYHTPQYRKGISLVEPQSAQAAAVGDIIYTSSRIGRGNHVELVTDITRDGKGLVTHVRVVDCFPKTTRNINYDADSFNEHIKDTKKKAKGLYRIFDMHAWRGKNDARSLLFPNYKEDSMTPVINRVLLLDRGDWVPYKKGQVVKFNIMDRDEQGVKKLVIKRGETIVEEIPLPGKGVIERSFSTCGNYIAYCIMADSSQSQACEFSVCDLDFTFSDKKLTPGNPLEIRFTSDNIKIVIIRLRGGNKVHDIFVTDADRKLGKIVIPADLIGNAKRLWIRLVGENKYGRLKKYKNISAKKKTPPRSPKKLQKSP